jgi:ankyrin repeat protein
MYKLFSITLITSLAIAGTCPAMNQRQCGPLATTIDSQTDRRNGLFFWDLVELIYSGNINSFTEIFKPEHKDILNCAALINWAAGNKNNGVDFIKFFAQFHYKNVAEMAEQYHKEMITEILNADCPPLLNGCLEKDNQQAALYLLEQRINPNQHSPKTGETPLHIAIKRHHQFSVVKACLEYGADVNACDKEGKTPFEYIYNPQKHPHVIDLFLRHGANNQRMAAHLANSALQKHAHHTA